MIDGEGEDEDEWSFENDFEIDAALDFVSHWLDSTAMGKERLSNIHRGILSVFGNASKQKEEIASSKIESLQDHFLYQSGKIRELEAQTAADKEALKVISSYPSIYLSISFHLISSYYLSNYIFLPSFISLFLYVFFAFPRFSLSLFPSISTF